MSAGERPRATPTCPPWCTRDHKDGTWTLHQGDFGSVRITDYDVVVVAPMQSPGEAPVVVVTNGALRDLPHGERSLWLRPQDAPAFATLMDTLGHEDVARLVRQAVETLTGGESR